MKRIPDSIVGPEDVLRLGWERRSLRIDETQGNSHGVPGHVPVGPVVERCSERFDDGAHIDRPSKSVSRKRHSQRTREVHGRTEKASACALAVHDLPDEGARWTNSSRGRTRAVHGHALKVHGRALKVHGRALKVHGRALKVHGRALKVRGCALKVRGRALKVRGCALKVRGRALKVRGCALKVLGRALKVRGRALEVRLWSHKFFARALFWARSIPFGEGTVPFGDATVA